jgi:P-type Cu2+ transporter
MSIDTQLQNSQQFADKSAIKYDIVHQIPGRIRLRVPLLADDLNYAHRLQKLLASDSRCGTVRLNRFCSSVAINYQSQGAEIPKFIFDLLHQAKVRKLERGENHLFSWRSQELSVIANSGVKLPAVATILALLGRVFPIPTAIIALTVGLATVPIFQRAVVSVTQKGKLNIDCLDFLAIALTAAQGNLLTPALVITLHEIGDLIRDRTARVTENQAADLSSSLGNYAWVEQPDGAKKRILATEVQPQDTVIVYPGEQISVDGKILQGKALIDQQNLTGESLPVLRQPGEAVYASTLVREGEIYIQAQRVGAATRAGASIALVQQAPVYDTRMGNYAGAIAEKTVLPALIVAVMVLAATRNPSRAASILTLDFVTGIRVCLPTTFLAALHHATRHGVLIRSGRALEKLAAVDTLVFDKTGTLTKGAIEVVQVATVSDGISQDKLLKLAAAAEQRLTHPVAEAVVKYAQAQGLEILPRQEFVYELGLGVRAVIEGDEVIVGSDRFLQQCGIVFDDKDCNSTLNYKISAKDAVLYVGVNQEFQGIIAYTDPLRAESAAVIAKLQSEYNMDIHLLTGDNQQRALAVGEQLHLSASQVHAEALPEQKAEIIQKIHDSGKTVAFTGDGLNDSIALSYADVAISFGGGSDVARETADVVLMDDNLTSFLEAMAIARETQAVIKQNINLVMLPNLAALGIATTVGLHPLAATIIHNGSAIASGLNALRPLMHQDPPRITEKKIQL